MAFDSVSLRVVPVAPVATADDPRPLSGYELTFWAFARNDLPFRDVAEVSMHVCEYGKCACMCE